MRHSVHKYINLWKTFFSNSLTRDMEFKANFIAGLIIDLMYYTSLYLFYHVIFQFTDSIGSFSKDIVIIFLIVTYMIDAFFEFFFSENISSFNQMIIRGNLDFILTKPVNSQFLLSLRYIGFNGLVSFSLLSILLIFLVNDYNQGDINIYNYCCFTISFLMGCIIWYCIDFMIHCLSFWLQNFSVSGWLSNNIKQFAMKPDTIYFGPLRKILFSFLPMALIASVPVRFLIFGFDKMLFLNQCAICIIFFYVSRRVWLMGVVRYESASS